MHGVTIEILNQQIASCDKCALAKVRTHAVAGEGNLSASVMFIGEAPGANEDAQGRPFCGKAGEVLDELLSYAGLKREEVFIGNILKCRPPKNRNPQSDEIFACTPYLDQQIEYIRPNIICCLGNFAVAYILKKFSLALRIQGITKIHGNVYIAAAGYGRIKIMPLFHPAVVTYDINKKSILIKDFMHLKNIPK